MTKPALVIFLAFVAVGLTACGKNNSGSCSGSFCNGLKFGTGIDGTGFSLVGESDTFSVASMSTNDIWFRLESAEDMGTRAVRIYIYSGTGAAAAPYWQRDYPSIQSYGHIMLSSFRITDQGTYEIRAYLVDAFGAETHVDTKPIYMTP